VNSTRLRFTVESELWLPRITEQLVGITSGKPHVLSQVSWPGALHGTSVSNAFAHLISNNGSTFQDAPLRTVRLLVPVPL
jgi:hypothetical protein